MSTLSCRSPYPMDFDIPPRPFPTYDTLPYADFLRNHLEPNTPFLLSAGATSAWSCASWRSQTGEAGPSRQDLNKLRRFQHHVVPVADTESRQFSEFKREERPLGSVLVEWEQGQGHGLYVKDWHLFEQLEREGEDVRTVYSVPECFRDDWLNPPFRSGNPPYTEPRREGEAGDFRFCYIGPRGTFTPLHRDVYGSYSWSANVVGRKLWWFFPPDGLSAVKDQKGGLIFDVREVRGHGGAILILQEEGEVVFVPSGWHHQVLNLDFCISINHNFFASPTLERVFETQLSAQCRVEDSIQDIIPMIKERVGPDGPWQEEWVQEVQSLVEMDAGWGWQGFWDIVRKNIVIPPAADVLSPPKDMRNALVTTVIMRYKALPEWLLLDVPRATVLEIEKTMTSNS